MLSISRLLVARNILGICLPTAKVFEYSSYLRVTNSNADVSLLTPLCWWEATVLYIEGFNDNSLARDKFFKYVNNTEGSLVIVYLGSAHVCWETPLRNSLPLEVFRRKLQKKKEQGWHSRLVRGLRARGLKFDRGTLFRLLSVLCSLNSFNHGGYSPGRYCYELSTLNKAALLYFTLLYFKKVCHKV